MGPLVASRSATAINVLLLAAMAGLFATGAAAQKPAGVRTALELIDRKWLRGMPPYNVAARSASIATKGR